MNPLNNDENLEDLSDEELDEIAEEILLQDTNPKIVRQIALLKLNENLTKERGSLNLKWEKLAKGYNAEVEKSWDKMDNIIANAGIWEKIKTGTFKPSDTEQFTKLFTPNDGQEFWTLALKAYEAMDNEEFMKDAIMLCEKYQAVPTHFWRYVMMIYIVFGRLFSPEHHFVAGLRHYFAKKDILKKIKELNFGLKIETNKETGESELFIHVFENTTIDEIRNHWKLVVKYQEILSEEKKIKKGAFSHPFGNMEFYKDLIGLDELDANREFEPEIFEGDRDKITDAQKALSVYENEKMSDAEKGANKIKQMRHQYKKRLDP